MIKYFQILKEIARKGNYPLVCNSNSFIGIGIAVYHLLFIPLDKLIGSSHHISLRLAGIALPLILISPFFKNANNFYARIIYEFLLAISLSQIVVFFLFTEYTPVYLYNGVLIGGFLYSLLSGYFLVPLIMFPLSYIGVYTFAAMVREGSTVIHFSDTLGIFFVAYFASISGVALRAGFDVFYYLRIALDEQRVKLETMKQLNEITNQKIKIQHEIDNMKEFESVGQFASGIAHDFNNILSVISGQATLLNRSSESSWEKEKTELIIRTVKKNSELIKTLLAFTRKDQNLTQQASLSSMIQTAINLAIASSDKKYIVLEQYKNELFIDGNLQLLQNELINLLLKVVTDLKPDVSITIELNKSVDSIQRNSSMQTVAFDEKEYIRIRIKIENRDMENYLKTELQNIVLDMDALLEKYDGHLVLESGGQRSIFTLQIPEAAVKVK
jgi:signal transduction histidine kinase